MLDEWLFEGPDELFRGTLYELMELRYGSARRSFAPSSRSLAGMPTLP